MLERSAMQPSKEFVAQRAMSAPSVEDYSEETAEAEFYLRQGLYEEAKAVYQNFLNYFRITMRYERSFRWLRLKQWKKLDLKRNR